MSHSPATPDPSSSSNSPAQSPRGLEHPGVIDQLAHDTKRDQAVLTIFATQPWTGSEEQLYFLQEKLNAYVSFALDGEMADEFPDLAKKPLRIEIDSIHYPDPEAIDLLDKIRQQLALQDITLEMRVRDGLPPEA